MFDSLSQKIQSTFKRLTGKGKLSEKDVDEALKEIRMALFEADVNFKVVREFLADVRERALGSDILTSLTPGQTMIKIVADAMGDLLGSTAKEISWAGSGVTVIVMAGVQGSGKTTASAKLALYLKRKNKRVAVAACDTVRPAAAAQLKTLCASIDVPVYHDPEKSALQTASDALRSAKSDAMDALIIDTAGRQHVDGEMMDEISGIVQALKPQESFFIVDCMMGQQSVEAATAFDARISLTGFILSKADSDARGGAALSVTHVTGKPIKFCSTGEKLPDFELFHPDRIASRILGMGDMLTLIEKAQSQIDEGKAADMLEKTMSNSLTLNDYLEQLEQLTRMGGMEEMLKSLPAAAAKQIGQADLDQAQFLRSKAIIQSMTPRERANHKILNASRRRRIAAGSGVAISDVNRMIKSFEQLRDTMKRFAGQKRRFSSKINLPF